MRFKISHPRDPNLHAVAGHNTTAVSFFCEVWRKRCQIENYDAFDTGESTIEGVLEVLIKHAFFTENDVAAAYRHLPHKVAEDVDDPDERRAAIVIEKLRQAGRE